MSAAAPALETIQGSNITPERIEILAGDLTGKTSAAIEEIARINRQSSVLALNAQIEAARSGAAAFGVVARAMQELSVATGQVAKTMATETRGTVRELESISKALATNVRGNRLSDLALVNIDLIDRNLYERSCDCRWWATDSSLVSALESPTQENLDYASRRMGVILNAYTVYFDLVLADKHGRIVANGRPREYASVGSDHRTSEWFQSAMRTASGDEFGFQTVHHSSLVNDQRVLVYSCGVRRGGESRGQLLGALGIVFKWDSLAQTIVHNTPLSAEDKAKSRVCIVDNDGLILADSHDKQLRDHVIVSQYAELFQGKKNFAILESAGTTRCVGHALSPGFETYATGWHSIVSQVL